MSDASASRLSDALQRASISDGCCDSGGCSQCNASKTPLINAARQGRSDIVAALLAEGVDANEPTTDGSGHTALFFACQLGHFHIVTMLLDANAKVNVTTREHAFPGGDILT